MKQFSRTSRIRGWLLKLLVTGFLAINSVTLFADSSGPLEPFPITGAYDAFHREDRNHISVIEISGDYNKNLPGGQANVEPRAVIAQEFFRTHPDSYDFLVAFSSFEFSTGDALAFYWSAKNDVQGIGIPQFDISNLFGSDGRLKGFIDMAALTRYATDPLDPKFENVLSTMMHEVQHQWGSFVHFKQPDNTISDALLGKDNAHWSYLLHTDGSVQYGARWNDNGDGTFTSTSIRRFLSPLDLYLMGLYKPEEVPPFFVINNPDINKYQLPQNNVTISGTKQVVTIDDIIAAEGPRVPSAENAQRDFRFAFVYLTSPGETVPEATITALNNIRNAFMQRFAILTGGRGVAQVYPEALPDVTTGEADIVTGGETRTTPVSIDEALAWLRGQQSTEGHWTDKTNTRLRDTTEALTTLKKYDAGFGAAGESSALNWLAAQQVSNTDYLARYAEALAQLKQSNSAVLNQLAGLQNSDGGWGIAAGYQSDPLDTALALQALASDAASYATVIEQATQYLTSHQNADGGWANAQSSASRIGVTVTVLEALKAVDQHSAVSAGALAWITGKQNADGGFGDSPSTVHDTARAIQAFVLFDAVDSAVSDPAANYIMSSQAVDGSWAGSVYATSLAVETLQRFNYSNCAIRDRPRLFSLNYSHRFLGIQGIN